MIKPLPERGNIDNDAPLRLSIAASLAFPDGSMTASGLRRENARGRLIIERIAGKDFTTLAHIERMRELCRVEVSKQPRSDLDRTTALDQSGPNHSSPSSATNATVAQAALREKLQKPRSC